MSMLSLVSVNSGIRVIGVVNDVTYLLTNINDYLRIQFQCFYLYLSRVNNNI